MARHTNIQVPRTEDALPAGLADAWARFLEDEHSREEGQFVYHDVFASPLLFPLQRQQELAVMLAEARSYAPKTVMEIGADKGGGLYHWCKSLPSVRRVIGCEIRGTPYAEHFEAAFPQIDFLWVEASSYAPPVVAHVREWLGSDRIDALFIDGDKAAFDCDFDAYLPLLAHPGIVFMHDIQDESPRRGYDKVIRRGYAHREVTLTGDSLQAMRREQEGISASSPHEGWLRHWRGRSCGVGMIYLPEQS